MIKNLTPKKFIFSTFHSRFEQCGLFGIKFGNNLGTLKKNNVYGLSKFSTIDTEEINNFNTYSEYSWFPQTHDNILLKFNHFRTNFLLKHITDKSACLNGPLSGKKVLDIGSGAGIFSEKLSELGADVLGVDASSKSVDIAYNNALYNSRNFSQVLKFNNETELSSFFKKKPIPRRLSYFKGGIEHINSSEVFDIIVASEVIEHVNNPDLFVQLISRLLKKNGLVLFTTLNRTILCYIYSIAIAEKILKIIPKGTHSWQKFIKPSELDSFANRNDLYKIGKTGTIYIPGLNIFVECENINKLNYLAIYKRIK